MTERVLTACHARRTGALPDEHRGRLLRAANPFSVGTVLVDGRVAAAWSVRDGRIVVDPDVDVAPAGRDELEEERARLEAVHA